MVSKGRRLSLFSATLGGGGAERVMATLANGFHRAGFAVDVVLVKRSGNYLDELDAGVNVIDLASSRTLFSLVPLIRYLRRVRPDAMLATQAYVNVIAALARILARVPMRMVVREAITASVHNSHMKGIRNSFIGLFLKGIYKTANAVIAPSYGVAADLIENFGISKWQITIIPNPLDLLRIQQIALEPTEHPWGESRQIPIVLGVGRHTAQKDFPTLIQAFGEVLKTHQARLLILGEGEDRESLLVLIESLGLQAHVSMPGFVENPFAYMKQAAVYVLSSRWEGLPNSLLQAIAVGTPVVATDCPSGPNEILEGGRWGRLVPVGNVDVMADAIIDALEGRLDKPPLSLLEERYGLDGITQRYLAVLTGA